MLKIKFYLKFRDITPVTGDESVSSNNWTQMPKKEKAKKFPLTEKECLKIGGHCWVDDPLIYLTAPPIYSRQCKHCGKRQEGRKQPSIGWHDI